jgi:hypothetical protein
MLTHVTESPRLHALDNSALKTTSCESSLHTKPRTLVSPVLVEELPSLLRKVLRILVAASLFRLSRIAFVFVPVAVRPIPLATSGKVVFIPRQVAMDPTPVALSDFVNTSD